MGWRLPPIKSIRETKIDQNDSIDDKKPKKKRVGGIVYYVIYILLLALILATFLFIYKFIEYDMSGQANVRIPGNTPVFSRYMQSET